VSNEIREVALVRSSGQRRQQTFDRKVKLQVQLNVTEPGDTYPSHWLAAADVTVSAHESGDEQYVGASTLAVRLADGVEIEHDALLALVWPHLRADLVAQCARIALQPLSLPLELPADVLAAGPTPAHRR
jgi:hypothetical protein